MGGGGVGWITNEQNNSKRDKMLTLFIKKTKNKTCHQMIIGLVIIPLNTRGRGEFSSVLI